MKFRPVQLLKVIAIALSIGVLPAVAQQGSPSGVSPAPQFTLMTSAYADGANIPAKYSCAGVSPSLQWSYVPPGTVSYALIFHDPDVQHPPKNMWDVTHWIVWNIPGNLTQLPEGVAPTPQTPDGMTQGQNYKDVIGYAGPCPPPGKPHHYTFELYALDTKLDLGPNTPRADVVKAMDGHIVAKAVYIGLFHR
jgi:Raf kinase inhibitor-like YbhB/YbcL family protein